MAKSTITHALAFLLGIGAGMLLQAKGCPPVPAPAAQPAPAVPSPPIGKAPAAAAPSGPAALVSPAIVDGAQPTPAEATR